VLLAHYNICAKTIPLIKGAKRNVVFSKYLISPKIRKQYRKRNKNMLFEKIKGLIRINHYSYVFSFIMENQTLCVLIEKLFKNYF